jgi:4-amino-4-deoxy-L-arabinose transferase-like glycosyltransferase
MVYGIIGACFFESEGSMPAPQAHRWTVRILLALAPIWLIGILDRGLWTPDEPREADIAWRMSQQSDRTLPQLADTPFLEKPPLSYWMSAAGLRLFGDSPGAARAPNLLYAAVVTIAVGTLAFVIAGNTAAVVAAVVSATAVIVFRVTSWLAPDACLLAGCALSLLGTWLGFSAPAGRRKFLGYSLMHIGAACGFMAKSAPGWMAPALALATLIVWERRWSELRRWELYAGLLFQVAIIGPWIYAVTRTSQGEEALLTLFWHNVVGRFTKVSAPAGLDYTTAHQNTVGKYFIELPVYLLPWTLLVAAALRRAWDRVRVPGPAGTPWRFALSASLPFLLVLSVAATARDIYSAPAILGLGLLVGLWSDDAQLSPTRFDKLALRWTRWLVVVIASGFALFPAVLTLATAQVSYLIATVIAVLVIIAATRLSARAQQRGDLQRSFEWTYATYATALCLMALATFPAIDRWHDLAQLARHIRTDSAHDELALLSPDETTVAMLDDGLRTRFTVLSSDTVTDAADETNPVARTPEQLVAHWFNVHGPSARVLVLLPGHAPGELTQFFARFHPIDSPDDGTAGKLATEGIASLLHRYEIPQGRRYALLGPPGGR